MCRLVALIMSPETSGVIVQGRTEFNWMDIKPKRGFGADNITYLILHIVDHIKHMVQKGTVPAGWSV